MMFPLRIKDEPGAAPHGAAPGCLRAFTLVELLVVLTIIGLLILLIVPATARAMQKAQAARCVSQLRQLGAATLFYVNDHDGVFPRSQHSAFAHRELPWARALAPTLGSSTSAWRTLLSGVYHCPGDTRAAMLSYGLNVYFELGPDDDYEGKPQTWRRLAKVAHAATTILFAENDGSADHIMPNYWVSAGDATDVAGARHAGKAHYLFVDGHVAAHAMEEVYDPGRGVDRWNPGRAP
jgi:prepilin-type processing-associated H-X9-DG protein/prepilin-type N-terminal cleavage/methylation domain-containing protein